MKLFALKLSNRLSTTEFNQLLTIVPLEKQEKINRFVRFEDAVQSLMADLLIRSLLSDFMMVPLKEIKFTRNRYGKPYLEGNETVHFNISHSGEWIVCGIDSS